MHEIIGIIGGNGVAATNKLCELIENRLTMQGAYRDMHHPEMIIWQATQAPSRSMFLEGRGESFIPEYIEIARRLETCGATRLCMCCNTAHYAIDEIGEKINIPFIDMVEAVVVRIKQSGKNRVGIIASDGCVKYHIYDKYIQKICPEVEVVYPNEEMQALVTKGICNVKNKKRWNTLQSMERPDYIFNSVKEYLIADEKAEIVISGCTDIRVDYINEDGIDSLEVLRDEIIKATGCNL